MLITTLALLPLAFATPQAPPRARHESGLQLPPTVDKPGANKRPAPPPLPEQERFRIRVLDLAVPPAKQDQILQAMATEFMDLEGLVIERARKAGPRDLQLLMVVARRFGTRRLGDELLFQALARPLGDATPDVLATMDKLMGADDGKKALIECVKGRIASARRHATDMLCAQVTADDLPFAISLSGDSSLDQRLSGVQLLAAIDDDHARSRLIELLSKEPTVAGVACAALIRIGRKAVPALQAVVAEPPIDRGHASCFFALACIGDATQQRLLPAGCLPKLQLLLQNPDATVRALAGVAAADLLWTGDEPAPAGIDAAVVEALLPVVAPEVFVANLDLLKQPASARLARLTGRSLVAETRPWREWWADQKSDFVAVRSAIKIDAQNAAATVVTLRGEHAILRLIGEELVDLPAMTGANEAVLAGPQMLAVVQALQAAGFGNPALVRPPEGVPMARTLTVQAQGARAQISVPAGSTPEFEAMVTVVQKTIGEEAWQLYRSPESEPDRGAFWRTERRWRDANTDPLAREQRFLRRVVRIWPGLTPTLRVRAIEHLFAFGRAKELLTADDGAQLLALVKTAPVLGEDELHLLELAAGAPGDDVWREAVDFAWQAKGGGRTAVARLFKLLGADRLMVALGDNRAPVRLAALDEAVQARDLRAAPRIVQLLDDTDLEVRRAAAFAAGALPALDARKRMLELVAANDTAPVLRRECMRSVGKIGGENVFDVLQRALAAKEREDRDAALRGIGELRELRAAQLLAEMFVASVNTEAGDLSRFYLQRMGSKLAVPALRSQLQVKNPAAHNEVVTLLGAYQDPTVVPDLAEMLRAGIEPLRATAMLEGIIGLEVTGLPDRALGVERWYRDHKGEQQWQWLLNACTAASLTTSLRQADFDVAAGMKAVPELVRIVIEAPQPRLRVLAAAVLRERTGEDYGVVTPEMPLDVREGIAARYKILFESSRAAVR